MYTYEELKKQAEELQKQAEEVRRQEMAAIVADIKAKIEQYGIALEDVFPDFKPRKRPSKGVAKFRDPITGDTWTGRGRKPAWLERAIAQGQSVEEFRITEH